MTPIRRRWSSGLRGCRRRTHRRSRQRRKTGRWLMGRTASTPTEKTTRDHAWWLLGVMVLLPARASAVEKEPAPADVVKRYLGAGDEKTRNVFLAEPLQKAIADAEKHAGAPCTQVAREATEARYSVSKADAHRVVVDE